jgi:hypothetical protein
METSSIVPEQQDEEKVDELLRETELPAEIAIVLKEFKEDHSGTPSLYLSFQLKPDVALDSKTVTRISSFITDFQLKLLANGLSRIPYAYLDEAA